MARSVPIDVRLLKSPEFGRGQEILTQSRRMC